MRYYKRELDSDDFIFEYYAVEADDKPFWYYCYAIKEWDDCSDVFSSWKETFGSDTIEVSKLEVLVVLGPKAAKE